MIVPTGTRSNATSASSSAPILTAAMFVALRCELQKAT